MSNKEIKAEDFSLVEENKEDMSQSVVKRENIATEFTISDVVDHQKDLEKMRTELESQKSISQATIDNIERNHEFITELTDEQKHHVWMWYENKDVRDKSAIKLEEVVEQLEQYEKLMEVLHKKFGFMPTDVTATDDESNEESK